MANILIVESNNDLGMLIKLNLMGKVTTKIYEKFSTEEALDLIEIVDDFELIICRDTKSGKEKHSCQDIGNFLTKNFKPIPILAITDAKINYAKCRSIVANSSVEKIIEAALEELGITNTITITDEYRPIPALYFLSIAGSIVSTDVYIRLKKTQDEFQYIKRIHAGEKFEHKDIERYVESGLQDFYLKQDVLNDFILKVTKEVSAKLVDQNIYGKARQDLNERSYHISRDILLSLGVDEHTMAFVKSSIASVEKSLSEENMMASFLKKLAKNQDSFSYNHIFLTCMLLHKIVESFDWHSVSVREKLTYIAYFHDLVLVEDDHVKIRTKKELESSGLTTNAINKLNSHAIDSAQMVDKFKAVPMGVSSIIREHHGSKSGFGFSDELSLSIAPLSMMFIVVEHFVSEFLALSDKTSKVEIRRILDSLKPIYVKSTYEQSFKALEKLMY